MQNTGTREPTIRKRPKANPSDAVPVTPSTQRMKPMPNHLGPEGFHAGEIAGDCMIVHVALHHRAKPDSQRPHTVMNTTTKALLDSVEFGHQALGNSLAFHREAFPFAGSATHMREPEEIEGLRFALTATTSIEPGIGAKLDHARLVRMERKAEALQTLPKIIQEAFRLMAILEPKDEVVGITNDDQIALCITAAPLMCPKVQDVVQINIGKQRRYHRSLGSTYLGRGPRSGLGHSCLEPFADQAEHTSVGDPVLEEFEQPSVVDGIEETSDVRIEHPVHLSRGQAYVQGV